jgi:hypothetical protein
VADLFGVGTSVSAAGKGFALEQVRRVDDASGSTKFVRRGEAPGSEAQPVMEEENLGHAGSDRGLRR